MAYFTNVLDIFFRRGSLARITLNFTKREASEKSKMPVISPILFPAAFSRLSGETGFSAGNYPRELPTKK
jgi:hypothetical protein